MNQCVALIIEKAPLLLLSFFSAVLLIIERPRLVAQLKRKKEEAAVTVSFFQLSKRVFIKKGPS